MIPDFRKDFFITASKFARTRKHITVEHVLKQQPIVEKRLPDGKSRPPTYTPPKVEPHIKPVAMQTQPVQTQKKSLPKKLANKKAIELKKIEKQLRELEIFNKHLKKRKEHPKEVIEALEKKINEIKNMLKIKKQTA